MLHPALMSADERRIEICTILGTAINRLFSQETSENTSNSLDFRASPSIHGKDRNGETYDITEDSA